MADARSVGLYEVLMPRWRKFDLDALDPCPEDSCEGYALDPVVFPYMGDTWCLFRGDGWASETFPIGDVLADRLTQYTHFIPMWELLALPEED